MGDKGNTKNIVNALDSQLSTVYGLKGRKVKRKVITTTTCRYVLENGGIVKIKMIDQKIVSVKTKNCDDEEKIKNLIKNIAKALTN